MLMTAGGAGGFSLGLCVLNYWQRTSLYTYGLELICQQLGDHSTRRSDAQFLTQDGW